MKSPIPKSANADIAARFGDVETYHATKGKSAKKGSKSKSGKQGSQVNYPSSNASRSDNSYKNNC